MSNYLLTGAGFSRNWGGWLAAEAFEYLLGCPKVASNPQLKELLWKCQPNGGFENALAELQADFVPPQNPPPGTHFLPPEERRPNLQDMQNAIIRMFADMNRGFSNVNFEFQQFRGRMVRTFLTRFDAIFTLNQDLLLEHHYIDHNVALLSNRRWQGSELPGMRPVHNQNAMNPNSWAQREWEPAPIEEFSTDAHMQPYFKLHGSSNWREISGGEPMLITGGNKMREIGASPILARYLEIFERSLSQLDARLMVIGYGFRDSHINDVIMRASEKGMRMFVIAPEGADVARQLNQARGGAVVPPIPFERTLEVSLIGASRRPLWDIFGGDTIEFEKVMRFFDA